MNKNDVTLNDICEYLEDNGKAITSRNIAIIAEAVLNDKLIPLTLDEIYIYMKNSNILNLDNINILVEELLDEGKKWENFKRGVRGVAASAFLIPAVFGAAGKSTPQLKTNTNNNIVNTINNTVNKAGNIANNTGKIIRNQANAVASLTKDAISTAKANKNVDNAQKALDNAAPIEPTEPNKPDKLDYLTISGDPESYDTDSYNSAIAKYNADKKEYDDKYKQYLADYDSYEKNIKNNPNSTLNKILASAKDKQLETNKTVTQNLGNNLYNITGGNAARSSITSSTDANYSSSNVYNNLPKATTTSIFGDVAALGATKELIAALRNRKRKIGGVTGKVAGKLLTGTAVGNVMNKLPVTKIINNHNNKVDAYNNQVKIDKRNEKAAKKVVKDSTNANASSGALNNKPENPFSKMA